MRRIATCLALLVFATPGARAADPHLAAAIASPDRSPAFVQRDPVRHPAEELAFFGLKPDQTVVEIWPSGGYWTEILAPYLAVRGHLYVALMTEDGKPANPAEPALRHRIEADPGRYGRPVFTGLGQGQVDIAPPGSADAVLTFRNLHNWMKRNYASEALAAFYRALKPGGLLGIEEHRARPDAPQDPKALSGYVREDYAIALIKKAGFVFDAKSDMDANPRDTTHWPKGVWTLPPTYAMGDTDRARYAAVGEGDNFVLRFHKPGK